MIPNAIKKEIKIAVFRKASEHDYMNRTRPENARFMHDLVADPEVGLKLGSYMEESLIKTYIKDGILNQYAKTRMGPPSDLSALLRAELGHDCEEIETDKQKKVSIYTNGGKTYVVACGTYLKWESALRKAMVTAAGLRGGADVDVVLVLSIQQRCATAPDMDLTRRALGRIGVRCIFAKV